jgi:hypothetical protein
MKLFQKIERRKSGPYIYYQIIMDEHTYLAEKYKGRVSVSPVGVMPRKKDYFPAKTGLKSPYRVVKEAIRRGYGDVRGTIIITDELVEAA